MKYSERNSRNNSLNSRATWLTQTGVVTHIDRQSKAKKEKEIVKNLKETGSHRNVKKQTNRSRATIPKTKYNKRYIRESMDIINRQSSTSPDKNQHLTTRDLANKGMSYDDVIQVANDLERESNSKIKYQFTDNDGITIENNVRYTSALATLHKYLHSFNI
jgi:hypothetical protein